MMYTIIKNQDTKINLFQAKKGGFNVRMKLIQYKKQK